MDGFGEMWWGEGHWCPAKWAKIRALSTLVPNTCSCIDVLAIQYNDSGMYVVMIKWMFNKSH